MAISNDVTTNRLNKKINYGVARTEMDSVIGPTGEAMGSPVFNPSNDLWINSDQLPASFLGTSVNTSDMLVYQYTSSASGAGTADGETVGVLELKAASGTAVTYGSGNYATYIACTNRSSAAATRLQDWIPFGFFGATYLTSFAVATEGYHLTNTNLSATAAYYSQIYPSSSGYEFYFDTDAGLLVFAGSSGPPSNLTAGRSIYLIKGARYQGPKGVANMPVSKLSDIHTATPSDSDVLIWDNGNSRWAPGTSLTKVDIGEANVTVANIATLYTTTLQVGTGTTTITTDDVKTGVINLTTANIATAYITSSATIFKEDVEESNVTVANVSTLYVTTAVGGEAVLDEDNMASDSATKLATQQSIKAYVDTQILTEDTIEELNDTTITSATENDVLTYRGGAWINSTEVDLAEANVTVTNVSTAYITTEATIATAKVSDLTSGRVVLAGTGGELEDHTNLTFDGTVLTSTEVTTPEANVTVANIATAYITTDATIATAKISDLTSGRVVLAGTSGEIEDSTNLTFDGTVLTSTELTTPEANITVANVSTLYVTTSVGGEAILDDDSFATASATTLATSESIKAYVDAEILTEDTIAELNDTTISPGLAENDVLTYRGGAWINSNEVDLAEANITVVNVATLYSTSSAVMNDVDITKVDIGEANVTVSNTVTTWITDYLCVEAGGYGAYINSKLHTPEANITVANVSTAYVTNKATVQNLDVDVRLAGSPAPVGMGCVPEANIAVANIATLHITTDSTIATAKISDLTDGRVVLAGTSGELEDSTNLTFDGTVLTSTEVTTPEANITVANVATLYVTSQIDKLDIAEVDIAEANVTVGNVATLYVPGDGGPTNLALNVGDGAITINTDDFTTSLSANATLQGTTQITQLNSSTVTESGITVAQYGGALGTPTNKVWANSSGLHYQTKQLAGTDDATALAIALG